MKFTILTLFPGFFKSPLETSIIKIAMEKDRAEINIHDIRDFSEDKHRHVDDYQYGGGAGMVMKPEPIYNALKYVKEKYGPGKTVYLSPQGTSFTQRKAQEFSTEGHLILLSGHYKGIDARICENFIDEEISIGDFVLTGGEIPVLVLLDATIRLIPDVLGNLDSANTDSFNNGLLEGPLYTRPADFQGHKVPDVLLSGHHKNIEDWRLNNSKKATEEKREDLYKDYLRKE